MSISNHRYFTKFGLVTLNYLTVITKEQIEIVLDKYNRFKAQVEHEFVQFPTDKPKNYTNQKRNELIALMYVLNYLNIDQFNFLQYNSEEPDFLLSILGDSVGVEILDYIPDEKAVKNKRHWDKLCDKLTDEISKQIIENPICFEIKIKNLNCQGCSYDDFKQDFLKYLASDNNQYTQYIDEIHQHEEMRTFAYINQGGYWMKNIDMENLIAYIDVKKNKKVPEYIKNTLSANLWLIIRIELTSDIDIEFAPTDYIKKSPFAKIFLVKGGIVKPIFTTK